MISRTLLLAFFAFCLSGLDGTLAGSTTHKNLAALPNDFMPAKILFPGAFYEFSFPANLLTPWFISTSTLTVGAVDGTQPLPAWIQWHADEGKFTCMFTLVEVNER